MILLNLDVRYYTFPRQNYGIHRLLLLLHGHHRHHIATAITSAAAAETAATITITYTTALTGITSVWNTLPLDNLREDIVGIALSPLKSLRDDDRRRREDEATPSA